LEKGEENAKMLLQLSEGEAGGGEFVALAKNSFIFIGAC
jgi:hypothetical protein